MQTALTKPTYPTVEDKLETFKSIVSEKDRMDKLKTHATGVGTFVINFTSEHTFSGFTIISTELPIEVVATIKTVLADFAEVQRKECIAKAEKVIKS